jgi:hypothetical protein
MIACVGSCYFLVMFGMVHTTSQWTASAIVLLAGSNDENSNSSERMERPEKLGGQAFRYGMSATRSPEDVRR